MMLVFPVARETVMIKRERPSNTVDLISIPKVILISLMTEIIAMAGMLSPILARAEPNAR